MRCCSGLDSGVRRNDGRSLDSGFRRNDGKELRTALISAAVTGKIDVRGEVA
jgi:hypothetical protein